MGFVINRVYTRSGDNGETGLVGGGRVRKNDLRVQAYGDVDELNAALGMLKELLSAPCKELAALLEHLQQELFDLGSELATPPENAYPQMWHAGAEHVAALEKLCDQFGDGLPELTSFILPGGSMTAAQCHVARTIARRAERSIITLFDTLAPDAKNMELLKYVNRFSDLLFVLSRWALAKEGRDAPLWVKADARKLPSAR